jgi:hypothetical protein
VWLGGAVWGIAGAGRGSPGRRRGRRVRPVPGGAVQGATRAGRGVAGAGEAVRGALGGGDNACGNNARERSGSKKGRGRVLYSLMFIGPTHQPMNISRLAYVAAMVPYICRPDEHKLHTSV